ncbi:MAG: hypothetical protein SOT81_08000 [Treponema sp.]|nr:hypothetical protein [Treponema sp.]
MKKIRLAFLILIFFYAVSFCAGEAASVSSSSSSSSGWTLAAVEFNFSQMKNRTKSSSEAAKVLPQLILERISSGAIRQVPETEILDRKLKDLQTERLALFLQLSKENQARDALVLTTADSKKLRKLIKAEDEKIAEIEKQIKENLENAEKEITESEKKSESAKSSGKNENSAGDVSSDESGESENLSDGGLSSESEISENAEASENAGGKNGKGFFGGFLHPFELPFFKKNEDGKIVQESVVLYKSDASALFKPSDKALEDGFSSWTFESEVSAQKINGLLSGKITSYGEYCSVTAELRTYPGAKVMGTVTEVGMFSELVPLANRIAAGMSAKISNTLPVRIEFDIVPREAADDSVITIDGVVQTLLSKARGGHDFENSVLVNAGIHRIVIESKNYETMSLSYSFSNGSIFTVKAELAPKVENKINIRLKKYKDGIFYANGLDSAEVSENNPYGTLSVNGKPSLAMFKAISDSAPEVLDGSLEDSNDFDSESSSFAKTAKNAKNKKNEDGVAFIQIPANSAFDGAYLVANAKPYDREKNIDHRRRVMYLAYTGLICSLPWTFYNLGNFTAENNAYSQGDSRTSYSSVQDWQKKSYISLGVTAAFGAWTVFELVRYLYAADKVLPVKAKIDKKSSKILRQIGQNENLENSLLNPVIETLEPLEFSGSDESLESSNSKSDENQNPENLGDEDKIEKENGDLSEN